jgi:type II secretory pathway pseudopilin PulG
VISTRCRSTQPTGSPVLASDDGFTLVELVMAILILFMALTASAQIIVSMVATTVANRHIDLAMSVASQTMETAVAFNCGGEILDPLWDPNPAVTNITASVFYSGLRQKCMVDTNGDNLTDSNFCPAATTGTDTTFDQPFRAGFLPTFEQAQTDLASRRFVVHKSASAFTTATPTGSLPVCTTIRMIWKYVDPFGANTVDDGHNDKLRLQRVVHVEWQEPRQTRIRWRELVQVAALSPDSKVASNLGRITVQVGVGKSATLLGPGTDIANNIVLTYGADDQGFVNIPFLPPGTFTILRDGLAPTTVTITATATELSQCLELNQYISKGWDSSACHR